MAEFFAGDAGQKYEVSQYRESAQIFSILTDLPIVTNMRYENTEKVVKSFQIRLTFQL